MQQDNKSTEPHRRELQQFWFGANLHCCYLERQSLYGLSFDREMSYLADRFAWIHSVVFMPECVNL